MRALLIVCLIAACGGPSGPSSPAANGVRAYVNALKSSSPRAAYDLLSSSTRKKISYDEFALQWKQSEKERAWQIKVLEESLKGNPDVGERARVSFSDGKIVPLERDGQRWLLESELVSRSRAKRPRDAIRVFADALSSRDVGALLRVLTQRRRDGLTKQVEGFVAGIGKRINDKMEEFGDRAELRWDENGIRYRIVLRKEDDEWRVDDIYIRPAPKDDEKDLEGTIPDDF
ncbi:MAG: hypothetical protein H0T65_10450 [Deltaproteobacteria bacterium]|nr:hypothetical protein [Deltaproteobacteria bacterium]